MEISAVIKDAETLSNFIDKEFVMINDPEGEERCGKPWETTHYNRALKDNPKQFTFLGLPVDLLYAYVPEPGKFCLFVTVEIDPLHYPLLKTAFGYPQSTMPEDFDRGDFDPLYWFNKDYDIHMGKCFLEGYSFHSKVFWITNMKPDEVYNRKAIFE